MNPETGFFGVAPGTSNKTNPNALAAVRRTRSSRTWSLRPMATFGGKTWACPLPPSGIDWEGNEWTPASGRKGAHPNSRFTAPASQCPVIDPDWENPEGVPLSAILFGGRRPHTIPLVNEMFDWEHGVFMGSTCGSETTAAALGQAGVLRRDPFAMLPFCGYNMARLLCALVVVCPTHRSRQVAENLFRQLVQEEREGKFLWPGFGENGRVIKWICERVSGMGKAVETPIGLLPAPGALDLPGLDIGPEDATNAPGRCGELEEGGAGRGDVFPPVRRQDAGSVERGVAGLDAAACFGLTVEGWGGWKDQPARFP